MHPLKALWGLAALGICLYLGWLWQQSGWGGVSPATVLKILGGVAALGVGVYLGTAGQYESDPEELDRALGPGGRTRQVKRRFTLFGWLRQSEERSSHRRRRRSSDRRFDLIPPEPPKKKK